MKQTGNVLIVLLVLMAVIASISIDLFNSSFLAQKVSTALQTQQEAFFQTEACLKQLNTEQFSGKESDLENTLDLYNIEWWQKHGHSCGMDLWYYAQSVKADIVLLHIYHQQHVLLQSTLKKDAMQQWQPLNWAQIIY